MTTLPGMTQIDPAELQKRKLGRVLTKMGKLTREQVHEALEKQREEGRKRKLGEVLVEMGLVTEQDVAAALAGQAGMRYVDLNEVEVSDAAINAIPAETALAYKVFPLAYQESGKKITVAIGDVSNFRAVDDLKLLMGFNVDACVADKEQLEAKIQEYYAGKQSSIADMMGEASDDPGLSAMANRGASIDLDQVLEASEDNKVIKLLNLVLLQAIKDRASDVHFEPFEEEFKMRYRIDGVLYDMVPPPKYLGTAIVSRIKVMADLDIAERRLPQDGRIELTVGGQPVDLRVAVLPTMHGESVVMRVLDRSNVELSLDRIGLRTDEYDLVSEIIRRPNGVVIVTGPTGSGKTTTLYAALQDRNDVGTKILTAEDPVEYDIDGLCQVQVNPEYGLTFAAALRSFLRQDPDVILVGEIRDLETAQIAVQASLTGHLVFSTLHTNDAPSSVIRLLDLGLEPFLLTATIEAIIAQRLVRRIDQNHKEPYDPTDEELMELDLSPSEVSGKQFWRGVSHESNHNSGYRGRMAIFEIMTMDDEMRDLVMNQASTSILREAARKKGMTTLRESGLQAIFDGFTSVDEILRETMVDD